MLYYVHRRGERPTHAATVVIPFTKKKENQNRLENEILNVVPMTLLPPGEIRKVVSML